MSQHEGTELKQALADATQEASQAPEAEEKNADSTKLADAESKEQSESEEKPEGLDYAAELAELQKERDQLKQGLLAAKKKIKNMEAEKRNEDDEEDDEEEVDTSTAEEVQKLVRQELATLKNDLIGDTLDSALDEVASSDDEKNLIKYHYENTIKQTGFSKAAIARDLKRAKLLANEKAILNEAAELKEALKARNTLTGVSGASHKAQTKATPSLDAKTKSFAAKWGVDLSEVDFNQF